MARKKVLIVDDSMAVVDALRGAFESAGYDAAYAVDGEDVFRKMASLDPAAVVLDIYMPKINGADVCRLVKAHPHWTRAWLVLMSARIADADLETYRRMGANDILRKPFEPSAAVQAVEKGIGPGEPGAP